MKQYDNLNLCQTFLHDSVFDNFLNSYRLKEKTFNLDKDVNFIYNKYFKNIIDYYIVNGIFPVNKEILFGEMDSKELKSEDAKYAHAKDPIKIKCGVSAHGSLTSLKDGNKFILLVIDLNVVKLSFEKDMLSKNDIKSIDNMLSEHFTKAVIYHELSHWVSNSKYNNYLYKIISKGLKYDLNNPNDRKKIEKIYNLNKKDRYLTNYEIDAIIHAIKQEKIIHKNEWDSMTLVDLFYKYASLRTTAKRLYTIDKNVYTLWVEDLVKRMDRENLLGKNMKKFPEYKMLEMKENREFYCF